MKIIRFGSDATVSITDASTDLGVVVVSRHEAYMSCPDAVGELVERPLWGFLPVRRRKVVAARVGDSTLLRPLLHPDRPGVLVGETVRDTDRQRIDDLSFSRMELDVERGHGNIASLAEKACAMVLCVEGLCLVILVGAKVVANYFGGG